MKKTLYKREKGYKKNIHFEGELSERAKKFIEIGTRVVMVILIAGFIFTVKGKLNFFLYILFFILSIFFLIFFSIYLTIKDRGMGNFRKEWEESKVTTTEHIDYKESVFSDSYDHSTVTVEQKEKEDDHD